MSYVLRAVDKEHNILFYTGEAGMNWLSFDHRNAFRFATLEAAEWRAATLNNISMIHGYMFTVRMTERAH